MSVLSRILDALDAPRFCPDCGEPVEVEDLEQFDGRTGEPKPFWVWHCPRVWVDTGSSGTTWGQSGNHVDAHGYGRPRWHRVEAADG